MKKFKVTYIAQQAYPSIVMLGTEKEIEAPSLKMAIDEVLKDSAKHLESLDLTEVRIEKI